MENIIKEYDIKIFTSIGEKYYLKDDLADFYFIFEVEENKEYERIPVHKILLAGESDVFRTMFNESWFEKTEVEIVDSSSDAFREFLQFFYFKNVKITSENIDEIFYLGVKYNVAECLRVCEEFFKSTTIDQDNLLSRFDLAIFYENLTLRTVYEIMLFPPMKEVLTSKSFLQCSQRVLAEILDLETLGCTEKELFDACMSWVKEACGETNLTRQIVNLHLGDSFYKLRFGAMSLDEFDTIKSSYGELFTTDEYNSIVEMITTKKSKLKTFSAIPRNTSFMSLIKNSKILSCNRVILATGEFIKTEKPYFINRVETMLFTTNKTLYMAGFKCAHSTFHNGEYDYYSGEKTTEITINRYPGNYGAEYLTIWKTKKILTKAITVINLGTFIRAGFMYEFRMKQKPPRNYCNDLLLQCEMHLDDDVTINFHHNPQTICSHVNRGFIFDMSFAKL